LPQRSYSARISFANASGEFATSTAPVGSNRLLKSGSASTRADSFHRISITLRSVLPGTAMPYHKSDSAPFNAGNSLIDGMFGSAGFRVGLVTATGRSRPSFSSGVTVRMLMNMKSTSPPRRPVIAGAPPL
jgi:hypothetical protein